MAQPANILMIAYHFAPESVSGTHRSLHFARNLHDAGHDVGVVTQSLDSLRLVDEKLNETFPFPERIVRVAPARTVGQKYVSLRRRLAGKPKSNADNPETGSLTGGVKRAGRISTLAGWCHRHLLAWDEFPDARRGWYRPAVRKAVEYARDKKVAAVFASGPPWTGVLVAWRVARRLGARLIVDFRDPWTGSTCEYVPYRTDACHWVAQLLERRVVRSASLLLFNTPQMMEAARRAFPHLEPARFRTILNGSDAPRRAASEAFPSQGPIRIRHFGSLYRGRSVRPLINALELLIERGTLAPRDLVVDLFGHTPGESNPSRPAWMGNAVDVRTVPPVPYAEAVSEMTRPSLLVVVQPPHLKPQIPTKLYDYLCTGNPVLVMAPEDSATWSLAKSFERCRRLDNEDVEGNCEVLAALIAAWRRGALWQGRTVEDTAALTKTSLGEDFVAAVDSLLAPRP